MATYQFRDVNENITATPIPAEAMQINGTYLETEITGYRTLYVKGREALSPELETLEIGTRDGSIRKSKRYPARIITVGYQIMAADDAAFREAYNRLGNILNVDDAEIIFNDEQDKFFIGTPTLVDEVDPGSNSITGEIEITCLDPLKYSVVEYEAETSIDDPGTLLVGYGGTYKAYPILEADFYDEVETDDETTTELTGNGDCGYVAFFTENEKIIQLGDPDEEIRKKAMQIAEKSIELAVDLGVRTVMIPGYDIYFGESTIETKKYFLENVKKIAEIAEREGILVGFETMENNFMNTTGKAVQYVNMVDSAYLKIYPDAGNITNAAVENQHDVCEDLSLGKGKLIALHLKETKPGIFREVPFLTGHVQFEKIINTAWDLGVRRYVTELWDVGKENWKEDI